MEGHRLFPRALAAGIGSVQGRTNAGAGRLDHLEINAQLPAVVDAQPGLSGVSIEHRGDVVLGMAGSEQHRRHGQDMADALAAQGFKSIAQDRSSEFQVAVLHRHRRQMLLQLLGEGSKFADSEAIAAAMAANEHTDGAMGALARHGCSRRRRVVSTAGDGNHDPGQMV